MSRVWRDKARADLDEEPPADDTTYVAWLLRQVDAAERLATYGLDGDDRCLAQDALFEARDELQRLRRTGGDR